MYFVLIGAPLLGTTDHKRGLNCLIAFRISAKLQQLFQTHLILLCSSSSVEKVPFFPHKLYGKLRPKSKSRAHYNQASLVAIHLPLQNDLYPELLGEAFGDLPKKVTTQ